MARFIIKLVDDSQGIKTFLVLEPGQPDWRGITVWLSKNVTARCVDCSGPLAAMSASCRHAQAVRRRMLAGTLPTTIEAVDK